LVVVFGEEGIPEISLEEAEINSDAFAWSGV